MKKFSISSLLLFTVLAGAVSGLRAGEWSVGANVVGLGVQYQAGKTRAEVRFQAHQTEEDLNGVKSKEKTNYFCGRLSRDLTLLPKGVQVYAGLEGGTFHFTSDNAALEDADGLTGGFFAGVEKKLGSRVRLRLDGGPFYSVITKPDNADTSEVDFVMNVSLDFYIGGRK